MKKIKFIMICIMLFSFLSYKGKSEITVYYKDNSLHFTDKKCPIFSAKIKASKDGAPIILEEKNTILLESNAIINSTLVFSAPDAEGWQNAKWTSAINFVGTTSYEIIVTYEDEVSSRPIAQKQTEIPLITFFNKDKDPIYNLEFTSKLSEEPNQIYLRYRSNIPCYLDSVTFTSPNFKQIWNGSNFDDTKPPKFLQPMSDYMITVIYKRPPDDPFKREYMIFHYNGGLRRKLELVTNSYNVPIVKTLKLLTQLDNKFFAPCQDVLLQWTGQTQQHPIIIDFSADGGKKWKNIDTVAGHTNEYLWKVPYSLTDSGVVRIFQDFHRTKTLQINYDTAAINAATFSKNSDKAITISSFGNFIEWDLYSKNYPFPITEIHSDSTSTFLDVKYISDNKFIVLQEKNELSELLFCNIQNKNIEKIIKLQDDFNAKKIIVSSTENLIIVAPKNYSNKIQFLDTNGKFIKYLSADAPIVDIDYNTLKKQLYVAFYNNKLKIYSLENFHNITQIDEHSFSQNLNLINGISVSQNAKLISLTLRSAGRHEMLALPNDNYIFDVETKNLFKKIMVSEETAIGSAFNPTGTIGVFGHRGVNAMQPQITLFDLTGKLVFDRTSFSDFFVSETYGRDLLGFNLAPTGNALIEYSSGENNCLLLNFSLPDADRNETFFTIENPVLTIKYEPKIDDLLIGTENYYKFDAIYCNEGRVDAVFQDYYLKDGKHFKILNKQTPDTLRIGECKTIEFIALALDTGKIQDEIIFSACGYNYSFPLEFYSKNRNLLALQNSPIDVGKTCLWETSFHKLALFKNLDTVPILVNKATVANGSYFYINQFPQDTLLQPNEIYEIEVAFNPTELGELTDQIAVYHSNQKNVKQVYGIKGFGIGTELQVSHNFLYFIPEIQQREITVKNSGNTVVTIDSVDINPKDSYIIKNLMPIDVQINEEVKIIVEYVGNEPQNANLKIIGTPCVTSKFIQLGQYFANATLEIPNVLADPRDTNVIIPIRFTKQEAIAYNGNYIFTAKLAINPRIFYPKTISSKFGTAEITENTVFNDIDKRVFDIKIIGDFNKNSGILAEIVGIAGLCEVDSSEINFHQDSQFWGKNVKITKTDGLFKLINLCGNRRISRDNDKLLIKSISPNPAKNDINLSYEVLKDIDCSIKFSIYNYFGTKVFEQTDGAKKIGDYTQQFSINYLPTGSYKLTVEYDNTIQNYNLTVVK